MAKRGSSQYKGVGTSVGLGVATGPVAKPVAAKSVAAKPKSSPRVSVKATTVKKSAAKTTTVKKTASAYQTRPNPDSRPRVTSAVYRGSARNDAAFPDFGKVVGEVVRNVQGAARTYIPGVADLQRASGGITNAMKPRRR